MFENIYLTQRARGRGEKISGTKNARDTENKHHHLDIRFWQKEMNKNVRYKSKIYSMLATFYQGSMLYSNSDKC